MRNIQLLLAYDGTRYLGWQKTNTGPSIEGTLQATLEKILQSRLVLQAASRTDAGVHAKGQVVNFFLAKEGVDLSSLKNSLNHLLPKDIVVLELEETAENFHATLDCEKKEYHYHLCYGPTQLPERRLYSWHFPHLLDVKNMRLAAQLLVGQHDFSAFCNVRKNLNYEHYVRHVHSIFIDEISEKQLNFRITGNNFLYKMVRNLVGTLVYVGCGKLALSSINEILESHDRTQAGVTAPALGLCLFKAYYPHILD